MSLSLILASGVAFDFICTRGYARLYGQYREFWYKFFPSGIFNVGGKAKQVQNPDYSGSTCKEGCRVGEKSHRLEWFTEPDGESGNWAVI